MFTGISATQPNYFIPYIKKISDILIPYIGYICTNITPEVKYFTHGVVDLIPAFVKHCREDQKKDVYNMLLCVVRRTDVVCNKHIPIIADCLKIGFDELDKDVRSIAHDALLHFALNFAARIIEHEYEELVLMSILKVIEIYSRDQKYLNMLNHSSIDGIMVEALKCFCQVLGNDLAKFLSNAMERLLDAMIPSNWNNTIIICSINIFFEIFDENMLPYLPRMTSMLKEFLTKNCIEPKPRHTSAKLAKAIGAGKFMHFFFGVAIELLAELSNLEVWSGLYSLFIEMGRSLENEFAPYVPTVVTGILASLQRNEFKANENIHLKEQEIKILKLLARFSDATFAPHLQACFDAVYDQLAHPEENIRMASIEALAQILVSFSRLNEIERSQRIAVDIIPKFANISKTDSTPAIVSSVFKSYLQLLEESAIVFDDKMHLFNEVFNCINDAVSEKLACQARTKSFENYFLICDAERMFHQFAKVMQPFECAVFFNSILPVLRDHLEKPNQKETTRNAVYHMLSEISALKAYASTAFDELFPLLWSGLRQKPKNDMEYDGSQAIFGIGALLLHGGEKAHNKSEQVYGEFLDILSDENRTYLVEATIVTIARLIMGRCENIPVEQFLSKIVEILRVGNNFPHFDEVFRCFRMLLDENNVVFLPMLYPIILIGLRQSLDIDQIELDESGEVNVFLKECREKFDYLIDFALVELPEASEIVRKL